MGIFRRVSDIVSANLNDLVDRFEDPPKMLKQACLEMEQASGEATAAAARAIASEKLIAKEIARHERESAVWLQRAEAAVRANDDALARRSIARKHEHDRQVTSLGRQLVDARATGESLKRHVEAMKAKHAEARQKLLTLTARQAAARVRPIAAASNATDAFAMFDRMQTKVELAEAESDALWELNQAADSFEQSFLDREKEMAVDTELNALKERMSKPGAAASIES